MRVGPLSEDQSKHSLVGCNLSLTHLSPAVARRSTGWKAKGTVTEQYEALGLASDLTPAFGRNKPQQEADDIDDDIAQQVRESTN